MRALNPSLPDMPKIYYSNSKHAAGIVPEFEKI